MYNAQELIDYVIIIAINNRLMIVNQLNLQSM